MASPASDPENREERCTQKPELSIFLTVRPSPKSIGEVQVQVHREPASVESTLAAHGVGKRRQESNGKKIVSLTNGVEKTRQLHTNE